MTIRTLKDAILSAVETLRAKGLDAVSAGDIHTHLGGSRATLNRHLKDLLNDGALETTGRGRGTRYRLPAARTAAPACPVAVTEQLQAFLSPPLSAEASALKAKLSQPLGARTPVSYERRFVDDYQPNVSSLLPHVLADTLYAEGRMSGQQPAGTYARGVLEPLLIDLSWASSRLEGNRYTLLDTRELFRTGLENGEAANPDKIMLLNHKEAIEFMVDAVPTYGLTVPVVRNLNAVLMKNLLADERAPGAIRNKIVNITDTVYVPTHVPQLLSAMLEQIVAKARLVKNPVEAAFFLWVNLAYLQPFEDGNKRTSRLSANIPLMLYNCAPLAFLDVSPTDYAQAVLGVYELLDVKIAVEFFAWAYRRSASKYAVLLQSTGGPDVFRTRHRELLSEAIQGVVQEARTVSSAVDALPLPEGDKSAFEQMLREDLAHLEIFNCARYRLSLKHTEAWINKGRPVD